MNRDGAETYLRVLAEAEMRGPIPPGAGPFWPGGPGRATARIAAVAQALTAVSALDAAAAADIMADFDLAVAVRQACAQADPAGWFGWTSSAGTQPGRSRFRPGPVGFRTGPMIPAGGPGGAGRTGPDGAEQPKPGGAEQPKPGGAEQPKPGGAEQPKPDRFVPVGLAVPLRSGGISGEMFLLSYAHTGSGARFTTVWRMLNPHPAAAPGPLVELLRATDDRGDRYQLEFTGSSGPEGSGQLRLHPEPPGGLRWLDIGTPGGPAVRASLHPTEPGTAGSPAAARPALRPRRVSPGEHLLTRLAERLLTTAPELPHDLRPQLASVSPGPFDSIAVGIGEVIAALEAAGVLSPLSPVPGQLAALCATLGISRHGITAPPAPVLPEPWLSVLTHYQRRKPDTAPVRDGYAAVAAALPEVDGVRLALLGLLNTDGVSWLQVLARGLTPEGHAGPFGHHMYFPLSVWVCDGGGRWHAARASGWHRADGEYALRLRLVPPLPGSTSWIEVRAAGLSAQVRAGLPLRWGCPS